MNEYTVFPNVPITEALLDIRVELSKDINLVHAIALITQTMENPTESQRLPPILDIDVFNKIDFIDNDEEMWKGSRLYFMSKQDIEKYFPDLLRTGYSITSPATPEYNCIAWAANDTAVWWEPAPLDLYYWPPGIPRTYTLDAYIEAYKTLGYSVCADTGYENDFEKIALYADSNGKPTHVAKQLDSGKWTSKLGRLEDIENQTLSISYKFHEINSHL